MDSQEAKKIVCGGGKELLRLGLVAGTWGNVSCRAGGSAMVITPSGIPYDKLEPDDMSTVSIEDLTFEGRRPSSESPMHAAIYRTRPEVNAVIHFHSLYACTASVLGEDVPPYLEDMAQIIGPSIRISRHALTGSPLLTENVLDALSGRFGALLENHGAVCAGRDMEEAFAAALILEKACQTHLLVKTAGGGRALTVEEAEKYRDFYLNSYQKR
ncbi:class II aldolase/adducin family protein [Bacilliculturomica massiliensis]|uniref:class II aldolase/adducin family protein n=1 Tax=Bacilliculturomica massiliensis TaxID=1917867 RepID=UPI001030A1EE|nr:class II aldolase/adducin family protein [Bacilliculturomica massiliensis]